MMHIADWLPTLYSAAGGDPSTLGSIDGVNMWHALSRADASPRKDIVHNVDSKLNLSGIRVGKYKLIVGTFNDSLYDGRFKTVQGHDPRTDLDVLMKSSAASKVLGALHSSTSLEVPSGWREQASIKCDTDAPEDEVTAKDHVYLFDIEKDPCEMVNIAGKSKGILAELMLKLAAHERLQVEPCNVAEDPATLPEVNGGIWKPME
ncbi:arylsulfatase I-like [Ixodes scapularis]|uniref:arylsulfatase I-like n=1 Tax=Ixodes scapularis TaxID=6945 RepID=UPI001AA0062A|nr:arylsulfatase I-like [Ixodes scapularis]